MSNQVWWIITMKHIKMYDIMRKKHQNFEETSLKIKTFERRIVRLCIYFIVVSHIYCMTLMVLQIITNWEEKNSGEGEQEPTKTCKTWKMLYEIWLYSAIIIYVLTLSSEVYFYYKLIKWMKSRLYTVYNHTKKLRKLQ